MAQSGQSESAAQITNRQHTTSARSVACWKQNRKMQPFAVIKKIKLNIKIVKNI
jgi:hypothetical protein